MAGVERLEFGFDGSLPASRVAYEAGPARDCGTGEPLPLEGQATLAVRFRGAAAHDDAGRATVADRDRHPALPLVRELRLTCDFEGVVGWAVGVARRAPFRVTRVLGPSRLVVELSGD